MHKNTNSIPAKAGTTVFSPFLYLVRDFTMGFCSSANFFGLTSYKESNKEYSKHLHLSKNNANYGLYLS